MKINLKTMQILVHDRGLFEPFKEYSTKGKFTSSLRLRPLPDIDSIWILYRLKKNHILQFHLRNNRSSIWKVYRMNKLFFSFTCKNRRDFIKIFEQNLKQEMEKLTLVRTKPPKSKTPSTIDTKPPISKTLRSSALNHKKNKTNKTAFPD